MSEPAFFSIGWNVGGWNCYSFVKYRNRQEEVTSKQGEATMKKIQSQGIHHITLIGADRQTSIDFWEGVLGMPFVFEQPNLDVPEQNHLYFDPGDGRLITIFTNENWKPDPTYNPQGIGNLHHIAFNVSRSTFMQAAKRLAERGVDNSGEVDRGFMDSLYFRDPLGQLYELSSYKFDPPQGSSHAEVLYEAHKLRTERGEYNIAEEHLADAIELIIERDAGSLSEDRSSKNPYNSS
jgi:catechol 2,3-dioxygenase-like lactoylglutathione lyase family enzyme